MRNKTNALIFYVESSCRNLHLDKTLETSENPADRFAAKLIPPEPLFGADMKPVQGGILEFASHHAGECPALTFGKNSPSGFGRNRKILKLDGGELR